MDHCELEFCEMKGCKLRKNSYIVGVTKNMSAIDVRVRETERMFLIASVYLVVVKYVKYNAIIAF